MPASPVIAFRTHPCQPQDKRLAAAVALLERLEIVRELLRGESLNPRISLALVLLENAADDIARMGAAR